MYDNLHLSPGDNSARYIAKANRKRKYKRQQKQSIEYKKRRRELKFSKTGMNTLQYILLFKNYTKIVFTFHNDSHTLKHQIFDLKGFNIRN